MPIKNPNDRRAYQREYRRTRPGGHLCTTPCQTPVPVPFRLKTAADVIAIIEEQVPAWPTSLAERARQ
jgi:hypothetical protein